MATHHHPTGPSAGPSDGREPLPASVSVARDRDGRLVYEVERGGRRSFVLVLCFLVVAVAAATGVVGALRTRSVTDIGIALSLSSLALVLWAAFLGVDRTRVRVVGGVCVVHRDDDELRFELRDPLTSVETTGDPATKKWRARLTGPAGTEVRLGRSQVDPAGFLAVLAIYRPAPAAPLAAGDLPTQRRGTRASVRGAGPAPRGTD